MEFKEFLTEMADLLEVEVEDLKDDFELNNENFSSVNVISTIALIDEYFDVVVSGKALSEAKTIGEILELIKKAKEE
ncbi:MAG: acyl carrier protein [Thermoanaerobacteraceae bacterium]|nr:acyl carrier protein [Thermoanaerobacteraceae bacterium]